MRVLFFQTITFDFCGQLYGSSTSLTYSSCRDYFATNTNYASSSPQTLAMGSYNLVPGYNKFYFPMKYFHRRGTMVYFGQNNGTISVACNASSSGSTLVYSDYSLNTNNYTVTNLSQVLTPSSKPNQTCAFEISLIIEYSLYNATTIFNRTYVNSSIFKMYSS